jgi:two-component system sensor histidine kinase PilS (NtrC family)
MEDLKRRLQWLMFFRAVITSFFLGIAAITQLQKGDSYLAPHLVYIYGLTGSVYFLTFVYAFIIYVIKNFKAFAYVQIMADVILITLLMFITGGVNSIFSFMYSISIISASIILYISGGILTATVSSLFYSCLIVLQHYHLISPIQIGFLVTTGYSGTPLYFPIIVNVSAFYLVAFLGSFLAEQTKKSRIQLQEKQVDLENLEALNENIIQSINSGLLTLDLDRRVITFNQAAQEITGLSLSQVYMKHVEEVFPDIEPFVSSDMTDMSNKLRNPRFEMSFTRDDEKVLHLGFSLSCLRDKNGNEIGNILGFQDLTSLKEMQDSIQRMDRLAAVGRLAAGIAHEVRNPLASISGSVQVLRKSLNPNDADRQLMDIIVRESDNLSSLISDFTQFAWPGIKEKEQLKLKFIVDEVIDIFKNSPECKNILNVNQDIKDDIFINANYQQFKQVLWNLMINASQAIHNDRGEISISARVQKDDFQPIVGSNHFQRENQNNTPSSWVEIQVKDTGCGIDKSDIGRIFDPFYTTKDRGIGLGLSIVHKIIQEHGGSISVESEKGEGTTFTVYLPQ